jgi:hypothetical protein
MKLLLAILILFTTAASAAVDCSRFKDDCQYYLCISEKKHCDQNSYPVKFGHQFCLRYGKKIKSFSVKGKRWVEEVRRCLIQEMNQFDDSMTCSQLQPKAFASHVPCYQRTGFCRLSMTDKTAVLKTIWPTLNNIQVLSGGYQVLNSCL